jgi:hypothetical protein
MEAFVTWVFSVISLLSLSQVKKLLFFMTKIFFFLLV